MKKLMAILLSVLMVFTIIVPVSAAETDVAAIGEATYATLAQAIAAAKAGDTVTLIDDVTENVTISKKITIDGAGNDYTGKITLTTAASFTGINFVDSQIYKDKGTGNDLTVKNCTFNGSYDDGYAISVKGTGTITIENCSAKDVDTGLLYVRGNNDKIVFNNVNIDGAVYGAHIVNNNSTLFENVVIKNVNYGVVLQNNAAKTVTFKNCIIDATNSPVYVWAKKTAIQTLKFKGTNDFGTDDLTFGSEYVKVVLDVAAIGTETYESLQQALAAAKDGDTIKVVEDHAIDCDTYVTPDGYNVILYADKNVTLDLNGKKVTAAPNIGGRLIALFFVEDGAKVTLTDLSEEKTGEISMTAGEDDYVYSMIATNGKTSLLTIEGGSYYLDRVNAYSMVYANEGNTINVTGGNFELGNAKTKDEGDIAYPWIFNVRGDGAGAIIVTGGTYNTDPTHHHGEAHYPVCYTAVEEGDKWVVKIVHTPGDAATCQAAQVCTICGTELDAIKEHTFGAYVSDNNATCTKDGTKTAECIYGCGKKDTVTDKGTMGSHADVDGNGRCDGCNGEFCDTCGKIHKDWMEALFCLIIDFIHLAVSFIKSI